MKLFLAESHSPNPFDLKAALLAGHAQHPVIIHFPIALFIASATGLGAWRWQLEGASIKGNLRLHMIYALTSASLIFFLSWMRRRFRMKGIPPGFAYFAVTFLALMAITLTGHLGGIL